MVHEVERQDEQLEPQVGVVVVDGAVLPDPRPRLVPQLNGVSAANAHYRLTNINGFCAIDRMLQ